MKKLLLGLGTIAAVAAPVTAVVACSSDEAFKGLSITYDDKTKLINIDFKKVAISLKETTKYKEYKKKFVDGVKKYNDDPTPENESAIRSLWSDVASARMLYFSGLSTKAWADLLDNYGAAIRNNPNAIGMHFQDRGINLVVENNKATFTEDKEFNSLSTFNVATGSDGTKTKEVFTYGFDKPFSMPTHNHWTTAGEFVASLTVDDYNKGIQKYKDEFIKKDGSMSASDQKMIDNMTGKMMGIIEHPSENVKLYLAYLNLGSAYKTPDSI